MLYLIRHGQTAWNAEFRLQGQADTEMNALGRSQADANGRRLAGLIADPAAFDYVASPLGRTREAMERVRVQLGLPAQGYRIDERLRELDFGDWQGLTEAEVDRLSPGEPARRLAQKWTFVPPGEGAESYAMLAGRVRPWLESVACPTVCVTHGGVIRSIFVLAGGMAGEQAVMLDIPQDRVLRLRDGRLEWL